MALEPETTASADENPATQVRRGSAAFLVAIVLAVAIAAAVGAAALARTQSPAVPADVSADAGFARDMSDHHAQAVEMALVMVGRTENPDIRILATDILLTQQAQVGMMRGWLDLWGLPRSSLEPRMAWMGDAARDDQMAGMGSMEEDGRMPGMATDEEIAGLRELPPAEADRRFLELMIRHHEGGVAMAQAGLDLGEQPVVRRLAEAVLTSQRFEIDAMRDLLARLPAGGGAEAGG